MYRAEAINGANGSQVERREPMTKRIAVAQEVPTITELEAEMPARYRLSPEAHEQRNRSQQDIKEVLTGASHRIIILAGPCAGSANTMEIDGRLMYDAALYQDVLRDELIAQAGDELEVLDEVRIITRCGKRKPRTHVGSAGLMATHPLDAVALATQLANNGAEGAIRFGVATELADPDDYMLADRFALYWTGARHDKITTLRHLASTPILDPQAHEEIARLVAQNIPEEILEQKIADLYEHYRKPFFFKTSTDGTVDTALDSMVVAAAENTNVFFGKDGKRYHTTTIGNPYTGLLFRGGNTPTPEAFREDLLGLRSKIDEYLTKNTHTAVLRKRKVPWGVDYSHATAKQCARGARTHEGQLRAHEIVVEEMRRGNVNPSVIMIESHIEESMDPRGRFGISHIDPCVSARDTARMILDIARVRRMVRQGV